MEDRLSEQSEQCKDSPQLFTYYQGDINTAVDEHFFRALNKATIPKDLSIKAKESNRTPKSGVLMAENLSIYHLSIYLSRSSKYMLFLSQMPPYHHPHHHHGLFLV